MLVRDAEGMATQEDVFDAMLEGWLAENFPEGEEGLSAVPQPVEDWSAKQNVAATSHPSGQYGW